ncbi:MAG TPA: tRNA (cytidine(56)-2'-O)-methyltransferase [Candidatus Thermoplasmatota archaeon]|nr:tRNA (cytidine(56)-2'-O)-methyltransferase [Candidatus Thermoplasmatota archaeon]
MRITVLRLGHRPERDKRITTHVCLTARAFGAERVLVAERDDRVVEGVRDVVKRFGGPFGVESGVPYRPLLKDPATTKVHLTMYGLSMDEVLPRIDRSRDLLVVVGAEKVPREVYDLADFNVGVGNQPHSEVAALAVFLYALQGDAALRRTFEGEVAVEPSARGKVVRARGGEAIPETGDDGDDPPGEP